jgi:hypothetical protein
MRPGQPTLLAQMTGKDHHMKTFSTISAMLLGLSTLGVLAQDAPGARPARPRADAGQVSRPNPGETFKRLDVNGDGKISKEEAPPRLVQNFDRFDIDKDGLISLREFNAGRSSAPANPVRPQRPRASGSGQ